MPDYGALWGGKRERNEEYARVAENSEKKMEKILLCGNSTKISASLLLGVKVSLVGI